MPPAKAPAGHFTILYFAAASTFIGKTSEHIPAPVRARDIFTKLEERYPGIRSKVLSSCAMTVNMEYVDVGEDDAEDADKQIVEGDEVAIIPPVSSG
jgi:molybdopterin converting factor small subunit